MRNRTAIARVGGCTEKGLETLETTAQGRRWANIQGSRNEVGEEGEKTSCQETDIQLLKGDTKGAHAKVFSSKFLSYFMLLKLTLHSGTA